MNKEELEIYVQLSPGKKRAMTIRKRDPDFYSRQGKAGGKRTQELHPHIARFRDKKLAREAGLKGLKSQGRA